MATESRVVHSDLAIPPGEYLEEVIDRLGMTKDELAKRMARPASKLSPIFKGDKAITPDTALQLEKVVGVSAHIWLGLEAEYRLALARQQELNEQRRLKEEAKLVSSFCYRELVRLGVVARRTQPPEKVQELQKFFGVASLSSVLEVRRYQAAFRCGKSRKYGRCSQALTAWMRLGEIEAQKIPCSPFSRPLFQSSLQTIRGMTLQAPKDFETPLHEILAETGIAMVLCPSFPGTKAHGATFWLGREKAVLMLSLRGKWADIFWFSLFHELGHLLLHDRQNVFIEDDYTAPDMQMMEAEADRFAADRLIPPREYANFVGRHVFYPDAIEAFASSLGIDPGIVVGRLQYDGHLKNEWRNDLRTRYEWPQPATA